MHRPRWLAEFTRRDHMLLAWSLLCLTRGVLYTPLHPGYGDLPPALTNVVHPGHVWYFGTVWLITGLIGLACIVWSAAEDFFWIPLLGLMAAWGGLYVGYAIGPGAFSVGVGGALYLIVGYGMWATSGRWTKKDLAHVQAPVLPSDGGE